MQHPSHLMQDMMVGPFRIQARLGAGGFGAVFRVECGGELYALKMASHHPNSDDANRTDARARRELACLLLITHPNVVRVWAHGRWPHPRTGYHYVVMDYVEGPTLIEWVKKTRPTLRQVLRLFDTLALTLDALHAQDLHHRDLKGSNILVRARDGEPILVDFGAAEHAGQAEPLTEGPLPPGTPHLRTPEALRFHRERYADPHARYTFRPTDDLYALGATLYEVLTGAPPFPPTLPREVLTRLIEEEMPASPGMLNPQVPPALGQLVLRLLAKRPEERPESGRALHEQLQPLLHDASPALDVALSPGADAATTEGAWGEDVMSSEDHPEGPLSGSADGGETDVTPGTTPQREATVPTALAERASPGSPRWPQRWWLTGAAALGLLALMTVPPWRGGGLPNGEPSPQVVHDEMGPVLHAADGGSATLASLSPDAGPPALAEVPPSSQKKGSPMRLKPPTPNPPAPQEPAPSQSQDTGVGALASVLVFCTLAGCATTPESLVGPPPRPPCPPSALQSMWKEWKIGPQEKGGYSFWNETIDMPGAIPFGPGSDDPVVVTEGRHEIRLRMVYRGYGIPHTLEPHLIGDFVIRDRVYARFTELRLNDGRILPFCAELYDFNDEKLGVVFRPESKPGAVIVEPNQSVRGFFQTQ